MLNQSSRDHTAEPEFVSGPALPIFRPLEVEKLRNLKVGRFESFVFSSHQGIDYIRAGWDHPSQRNVIKTALGDSTIDSIAEGVIDRPAPDKLNFIVRYLDPSANAKDVIERIKTMVAAAIPEVMVNAIDIHKIGGNYRNETGLIEC